jgi:hypothetical protein
VAHPNIGIVVTYGAADNVRKTPKSAASPGRSKPMEAISDKDIGYYEAFGKLYRARLGLGKDLEGASEPGTFSDWMYFHRGRLSLAVRPWDPPWRWRLPSRRRIRTSRRPRTRTIPTRPRPRRNPPRQARTNEARTSGSSSQWFDEHAPEAFVAWQAIEHPDFPGRRVEVGGYRPFALTNPPVAMLDGVAAKQGDFLTELAGRLPRIEVARIECRGWPIRSTRSRSSSRTRASCRPPWPTARRASRSSNARDLELEPECFLAGARTTFLPTIAGSGGTAKARCTVRASRSADRVKFEVISTLAGRVKGTVELLKAGESVSD